MHNSVVVQVLDTEYQLVGQFADSVFTQVEISSLQVVKQIRASHVVKHYVVVFGVLEQINQVDDVGMLAHFENLDFAPLLEDLNVSHVLLFHLLDSDTFVGLLVLCKLDQAELSLAERFVKRVKLEHIRVTHGLLQLIYPSSLVILF